MEASVALEGLSRALGGVPPELGSSLPASVISERLLRDEGWVRSAQAGMGTFVKEPQAGLAPPEVGQRWAKVLETEDVGRHGPSRGLSLASVLELQTIGPGCIYFPTITSLLQSWFYGCTKPAF